MDEIVAALADQHAELDSLLVGLDDTGWQRPSACPGWSISDVVLHLSQTDAMAIASATGHYGEALATFAEGLRAANNVDDGAALMVERERGAAPADTYERWRRGAAELRSVLRECSPSDRVQWVAGQMAARTLATTRLAECWIHTGDVADGLGVDREPPGDRLRPIARLAWRTIPYAFARAGLHLAGPVAFELRSPAGEDWTFLPDEPAVTTIRGDALDLCLVAGQRRAAADTGLRGDGADGAEVLRLVRTFA